MAAIQAAQAPSPSVTAMDPASIQATQNPHAPAVPPTPTIQAGDPLAMATTGMDPRAVEALGYAPGQARTGIAPPMAPQGGGHVTPHPPGAIPTPSPNLSPINGQQYATPSPNLSPLNGQQYDEEQIRELEKNRQIALDEAKARQDAVDREAEIQQKMADASRSAAEDANVAVMTHYARQAQDVDGLRARIAEVGAQKIDPDHWWNSKSTGGKIAAVIGMIIGGFAQGAMVIAGNKSATNPAVDVAQRAIADDIDAQKSGIGNQWKEIQDRFQLKDDAETRFLHEQAAKSQANITGLEAFKFELAKSAAGLNSQIAQVGVQHAMADATAKQNMLRNHISQLQQQAAQAAAAAQAARLAAIQKKRDAYDKAVEEATKGGTVSEKEANEKVQNSLLGQDLRAMGLAPKTVGMSEVAPAIREKAIATQEEAAKAKAAANPEATAQVQALEQILNEHDSLERAKREGNAEAMETAAKHVNALRRQALGLPARMGADGKPIEGLEVEKEENGLPVRQKGMFGSDQSIGETILHNWVPGVSGKVNASEEEKIKASRKFYEDMLARKKGELVGVGASAAPPPRIVRAAAQPPRGEEFLK
jgi:hypothetical protein